MSSIKWKFNEWNRTQKLNKAISYYDLWFCKKQLTSGNQYNISNVSQWYYSAVSIVY